MMLPMASRNKYSGDFISLSLFPLLNLLSFHLLKGKVIIFPAIGN